MYLSRNYNMRAHHLASLGHSNGPQEGVVWFEMANIVVSINS